MEWAGNLIDLMTFDILLDALAAAAAVSLLIIRLVSGR